MGRDVGAHGLRGGVVVEIGELGVDVGGGGANEVGEGGGVGFSDRFAVPAGALGVKLLVVFLVLFRGPGEGVGDFRFFNFVVVVDELRRSSRCVGVVGRRGELMSVPCEIDIESGDGSVPGVCGHNLNEALIFCEEAMGCGTSCWGVNPVYGVHFFDESTLPYDGADKVKCKGR